LYSKYEKILTLPRFVLGLAGAAVIALMWRFAGLAWPTAAALAVMLLTALAASRLVSFLHDNNVSPNAVTIAGLIASLAAICPLAQGRFEAAFVLVCASGLLDTLDGYLARRFSADGRRGGFLDSVTDRVSDAAIFGGLIVHYAARGRILWVCIGLAAMAGAYMVSYVRAKAECHLDKLETGLGGERPDRIIALVVTGLAGRPEIGLVYVVVFSWLTTVRRFAAAWTRLDG